LERHAQNWVGNFLMFFVVPHLTVFFLFFYNEPELGVGIDPGMALTPFSSGILEETRFEPTTFVIRVC